MSKKYDPITSPGNAFYDMPKTKDKPAQGHTPGPPEPSVYSYELAAVVEQRDDLLAACKYAEQYLTGAGAFAAYQKVVAAIAKTEGRAQ